MRGGLFAGEVQTEGVHFRESVLVAGTVGRGDALVEALDCLLGHVVGGHGLGGHLVGGDVVGVEGDEVVELGEGFGDAGLGDVFHSEAVAGEGVAGVLGQDLGEHCELVHLASVRV